MSHAREEEDQEEDNAVGERDDEVRDIWARDRALSLIMPSGTPRTVSAATPRGASTPRAPRVGPRDDHATPTVPAPPPSRSSSSRTSLTASDKSESLLKKLEQVGKETIQKQKESGRRFLKGDTKQPTRRATILRRASVERRLFALSPHAMLSKQLSFGVHGGPKGAGMQVRDPFMVRPNGKFRIGWDLVTILWLVYLLFSLPVYLGFELDGSEFQDMLENLVLAFFVLDILVNFRTGYFDEIGNLVAPPLGPRHTPLPVRASSV